MIRILHTADLHIGATLRRHGRESEQCAVLDFVVPDLRKAHTDAAHGIADLSKPRGLATPISRRRATS
ncbi:hypothetical protein [Lichenibacterium ramalinae]|uniref:Uncharacterized protein n=1 Tax=Lichenibacterium ramalinae TaxID=2316527 RepID=A0A4Q2R8Q7_9HYPH|nr:hypothetical protein [Lichenibacterium ramalinae]RYB01884.1 hypothetical protein D3272_23565 [Lichenibacterium ramalinae]